MSADNYVAVRKIGNLWHVWMVLGGYEESDWTEPGGGYHTSFNVESMAYRYATQICNEEIVEYGIRVLDPMEE